MRKKIITPQQAIDEARKLITSYNKEHIIGLYLGPENNLKHTELVAMGTLDASIIHPRDVFEPAICKGCAGFVLLHNHPSSNVNPSPADIKVTKRLIEASKLLQLQFLDHIIFWEGKKFFSMNKKGYFKGGDDV